MTPEESQNFVTVLQGYWPKLIVSADDIQGWLKRLWRFDYEKAKTCVERFKFSRTRQGLPPAGVILGAMKAAVIPKEGSGGEPVELYVIIRPNGKRDGFPVASARGVPANTEAVQLEAEELCKRVATVREKGIEIVRPGFAVQWLCEAVAPSMPF